jgi:hypothetical protein
MKNTKDVDKPNYTRYEYDDMLKRWHKLHDIRETTTDIKDLKNRCEYIPQHILEDAQQYRERLMQAVLNDAVDRTIKDAAALITKPGYSLDSIKNDELRNQIMNPTIGGGGFMDFLNLVTTETIAKGHTCIFIDAPKNEATNLAEEVKQNVRPYWNIKKAEAITNWLTFGYGLGQDSEMVTFHSCVVEKDGKFGAKKVDYFLVLEKDQWTKYREEEIQSKDESTGELHTTYEYKKVDSGQFTKKGRVPLGYSPIAISYYFKENNFVTKLPLKSLMDLVIQDYSFSSDLQYSTRMNMSPIGVFSGLNDEERKRLSSNAEGLVPLGSSVGFCFQDAQANFKFTETSGQALQVGQKHAQNIKTEINAERFAPLVRDQIKYRDVSATEAKYQNDNALSPLAIAAQNIEEALNAALKIHADYLGIELGPEERIQLNVDLNQISLNPDIVRVMIELVDKKIVPVSLVMQQLTNGKLFRTNLTPAELIKMIQDEQMELFSTDEPDDNDPNNIEDMDDDGE